MNRTTQLLLLAVFLIAFFFGITKQIIGNPNKYYLDHLDWKLHLSWAGTARNTIVNYGQAPLWNPYRCGGVPVIGEPESDIVSPFLPFLIVFGPLFGYLMFFLVNLLVGCIGFYKVGRYYRLSPLASVLIGETYMVSGLYIFPFFAGMTNFIAIGFLPFVILFFERYLSEGKFSHAIWTAFFTALMYLSGFHYIVILLIYIGVSALIHIIQRHSLPELKKAIWVGVLFLCFSAVKFIRTIELLFHHRGTTYSYEATGGFSLTSLLYSLLSRDQTTAMIHTITTDQSNVFFGANYDIEENGMYIGIFLFMLFIVGLWKKSSKIMRLIYVGVIFLLISFGTHIYPSLYELVRTIPMLSSIRVANRFRYIFMVPVVICIGFGFDLLMRYLTRAFGLSRRMYTTIAVSILLFVGADLIYVNFNSQNILPIVQNIQIIQPNKSNAFYNRCSSELSEYELIMQNQGHISCYDNVLFSSFAVCKENENYKGRTYLLNGEDTASLIYFSPTKLRVQVTSPTSDVLIVNQNYSRYWSATIDGAPAPAINTRQLLSVQILKGEHTVEFRYFATWVYYGAIISTISLLCCGIYLWIQRKQ